MVALILAHQVVFAVLGISIINFIIDVAHPNPAVNNIFNLILPFLRKEAGQA